MDDDMDIDEEPPADHHQHDDAPDHRRDGPRGSSPSRSSDERGRAAISKSRKRPRQSPSPPPAPPPKRKRKEPQFAQGYVVTSAKPKAADYEPVVKALLIRAMAEYAMLILSLTAFPDIGLQTVWASRCFKNACRAADQHYKLTERMAKLASTIYSLFLTILTDITLRSQSADPTFARRL